LYYTPVAQTYAIGDILKMGDYEFVLNSVRYDGGSQYLKPEAGTKWLLFDCSITNNGSEPAAISSMLMFKVYDTEHYLKDMAFGPEIKGSLDGELGIGRTMRGEVAYTVSENETDWEFIFESDFFDQGQAIYNVNVNSVKQ